MELNLPTMTLFELPQFGADALQDIIPGAPLLDDIERYHSARSQFLRDQETVQRWVEQTCPTLIQQVLNRKIETLFEPMVVPVVVDDTDDVIATASVTFTQTIDPQAGLQAAIDEIKKIKASALDRLTGPAFEKRKRMHEALMEVHGTFAARVKDYTNNLSANRALSMLFTDDDDGDDDVQSASEVEARTQATGT